MLFRRRFRFSSPCATLSIFFAFVFSLLFRFAIRLRACRDTLPHHAAAAGYGRRYARYFRHAMLMLIWRHAIDMPRCRC